MGIGNSLGIVPPGRGDGRPRALHGAEPAAPAGTGAAAPAPRAGKAPASRNPALLRFPKNPTEPRQKNFPPSFESQRTDGVASSRGRFGGGEFPALGIWDFPTLRSCWIFPVPSRGFCISRWPRRCRDSLTSGVACSQNSRFSRPTNAASLPVFPHGSRSRGNPGRIPKIPEPGGFGSDFFPQFPLFPSPAVVLCFIPGFPPQSRLF